MQPIPIHAKQILNLDPSTMFRKKVQPKVVNIVECNTATVQPPQGCGKYVPSSNADEYYKKYLERSKVHEMVHEDVWSRAERQMKEIDECRLVSHCICLQISFVYSKLTEFVMRSTFVGGRGK